MTGWVRGFIGNCVSTFWLHRDEIWTSDNEIHEIIWDSPSPIEKTESKEKRKRKTCQIVYVAVQVDNKGKQGKNKNKMNKYHNVVMDEDNSCATCCRGSKNSSKEPTENISGMRNHGTIWRISGLETRTISEDCSNIEEKWCHLVACVCCHLLLAWTFNEWICEFDKEYWKIECTCGYTISRHKHNTLVNARRRIWLRWEQEKQGEMIRSKLKLLGGVFMSIPAN